MSEAAKDKKSDEAQHSTVEGTVKMSFIPDDIELTQKINFDYEKIIDKGEKKQTEISANEPGRTSLTGSLTGISLFSRKRIADDFVKSNSILTTINSISPLKGALELRSVYDNYDLKQQFSEGAQGIIRTAFDKSLKRNIVIKSLKSDEDKERAQEDESLFVSEARIMAQLDHPSIIPLYGLHCGTKNKLHLAMKHIHGKTLYQYLHDTIALYKREGVEKFDEKRSIATRIEYLMKVCEAVDYAHCKGVIHRDLKPENIMIGNYGEVYVMDWGLACLVNPEKLSNNKHQMELEEHSRRELVGTPCYIAPELIRGEACSPQSDIFSLGMMLFDLVFLERAVLGETVNEALKNIINCNYHPFKHRFLEKDISSDLKAIIAKAICPSLSRRYKTANDMAADLKLYLMREETTARPDNFFRKCVRAMSNHKMITSTVVLAILLCLSGSTGYSLYSQNILMKEQDKREKILTNFQNDVAERANEMERIFFYFRTQLANAAYNAENILSGKVDITLRGYVHNDFLNASTAPDDYAYSSAYDRKISLNYAVLKLGPKAKLVDKKNKKVIALQKIFKHIMFTSDPKLKHETKSSIRKIIINKGVPLIWIFIGLKNGSMFSYPGKVYSKDYDPRKRPWYKIALPEKDNITWSKPYKAAVSSKMIMSCTRCIFDEQNNFQGVIGMDISLDYIQRNLFRNQTTLDGREYLLNKKGEIVLSSNFKDEKAKIDRTNVAVKLKKFSFQKEFQKTIENKLVQFEVIENKKKYVFALNSIPSLGYYYLEQISEAELQKSWEESTSYKKK